MNRLFDSDNMLNRFLAKVFDCGILSVLWIVCSIPIITIGASTIAMYSVTLKMVKNEEGTIARSFFKAFKANFRQSVPVTLIGIFVYAVLFLDYSILGGMAGSAFGMFKVLVFAMAFLVTAVYVYVCPLLAMFVNTVKGTFNNAWRLAILNPVYTVTFVILTVGPYIYFIMRPDHFLIIFPLWFLLGPGGLAYIMSAYFRKIFDKLIPEDEDSREAAE